MLLMKDIIDDHHPLIREISQPVEMPICQEDEQLLLDMHEFLVNSQDEEMSEKYHLRPAVGIAAVQVGVLKRMCAIHVLSYDDDGNVSKADDYALVNPKIVSYTEKGSYLKDGEGCLSVNDDVEEMCIRDSAHLHSEPQLLNLYCLQAALPVPSSHHFEHLFHHLKNLKQYLLQQHAPYLLILGL